MVKPLWRVTIQKLGQELLYDSVISLFSISKTQNINLQRDMYTVFIIVLCIALYGNNPNTQLGVNGSSSGRYLVEYYAVLKKAKLQISS